MLLLLVAGSGLAGEPEPNGPSEAAGAGVSAVPSAPWFNVEADTPGDVGQHTSITIDQDTGVIWVSYYDVTNKDLRVAKYMGRNGNCGPDNSWRCQTVDSAGDVGQYSSIAVWEEKLMVAYYDAGNKNLKMAMSTDPIHWVWDIVTLDTASGVTPSTGLYTSAKFSATGQEFIAYYFDNPTNVDALKVAYHTYANGNCPHPDVADTWRCETIISGEGVGQFPSLEVVGGVNHEVYIAYYNGGTGELWFATTGCDDVCNCGFWEGDMACYPVDVLGEDQGRYASLYVDSSNHFHIAYYDAIGNELKYAVQLDGSDGNCGVGGSAQCDAILWMQADDYHPLGISIAEDANGYPIIAYQSDEGDLNVARPLAALNWPPGRGNCGPGFPLATWYCQTIDSSGTWVPYRNGDFASIAVDSSGYAMVAYYRYYNKKSDGNLTFAYQRPFQVFLPLVMKNR